MKININSSKQFGYLFTKTALQLGDKAIYRTIAHELAHGSFHLNHTFDSQYQIARGSTQNLLDYTAGTGLVKHQWDAIYDPGLVIGMFESDEEAMSMVSLSDIIKAAELRAKYVELFYNIINKQIISTQELVSINGLRGSYEKSIIENVISSFIHIDPTDLSVFIFLPNDKKGLDCVEISSTVSDEVIGVVLPLTLQTTGAATQKFGDIIYKASISKISYELLKSRIGSKVNISPALNSLRLSKLSQTAGKALGTIGKVVEKIGTISLWYTLLTNDMGPGEVTDERIQESTTRAFIRAYDEIMKSIKK